MKMLFSTLVLLSLLTACASQPVYRAAESNGYGYKETAISDTQYRINFKMRGEDNSKASDLALLRAAELTLLKGYDWFEVVNRETTVEKKSRPDSHIAATHGTETTRRCGLLGCETTTRPSTHYTVGVHTGTGSDKVERSLQIAMGKGVRPDKGSVFSAEEVRNNIKNKYDIN